MAYTEKFYDIFTEASDALLTAHTPDTGTSWTAGKGNLGSANIDSVTNTVEQPWHGGTLTYSATLANKGSAWGENQSVEATGIGQAANRIYVLPACRIQDSTTYSAAYLAGYLSGSWRIFRMADGETDLALILGSSADASQLESDKLELRCESGTQELFLNDVSIITASDTTLSGGSPGILSRRTFAGPGLDNFRAYDEAASGSTIPQAPLMGPLQGPLG